MSPALWKMLDQILYCPRVALIIDEEAYFSSAHQ